LLLDKCWEGGNQLCKIVGVGKDGDRATVVCACTKSVILYLLSYVYVREIISLVCNRKVNWPLKKELYCIIFISALQHVFHATEHAFPNNRSKEQLHPFCGNNVKLSHLIFRRKPNASHMCVRIKFTHI
jgi:hypothetical protein